MINSMHILEFSVQWIRGRKCYGESPRPPTFTFTGYSLEVARKNCEKDLKRESVTNDYLYANLYYSNSSQICYLYGSECGNWTENIDPNYHFFQKGIIPYITISDFCLYLQKKTISPCQIFYNFLIIDTQYISTDANLTCSDEGLDFIDDLDECKALTDTLDLEFRTETRFNFPKGCYLYVVEEN